MSKLRLNNDHRRALRNLADDLVKCPAEEKAEAAAHKKAAGLVTRDLQEKYPPRDMKVLEKYEQSRRDDCMRIQMTSGGVTQFQFAEGKGPITPHGYCRVYAVKEDTTDAIQDWENAKAAHAKAREQKLGDYHSLVEFSRTLEDVEAVWSEASQIRSRFAANLPVALSEDVAARIATDVAQRAKAA